MCKNHRTARELVRKYLFAVYIKFYFQKQIPSF